MKYTEKEICDMAKNQLHKSYIFNKNIIYSEVHWSMWTDLTEATWPNWCRDNMHPVCLNAPKDSTVGFLALYFPDHEVAKTQRDNLDKLLSKVNYKIAYIKNYGNKGGFRCVLYTTDPFYIFYSLVPYIIVHFMRFLCPIDFKKSNSNEYLELSNSKKTLFDHLDIVYGLGNLSYREYGKAKIYIENFMGANISVIRNIPFFITKNQLADFQLYMYLSPRYTLIKKYMAIWDLAREINNKSILSDAEVFVMELAEFGPHYLFSQLRELGHLYPLLNDAKLLSKVLNVFEKESNYE